MINLIVKGLEIGLAAVIVLGLLARFLRDYVRPPVRVEAEVADLYQTRHTQAYHSQPARNKTEFVAVFDCGKTVKKFFVSAFVYDTLRKGQRGNLRYRGSRFLEFQQETSYK